MSKELYIYKMQCQRAIVELLPHKHELVRGFIERINHADSVEGMSRIMRDVRYSIQECMQMKRLNKLQILAYAISLVSVVWLVACIIDVNMHNLGNEVYAWWNIFRLLIK